MLLHLSDHCATHDERDLLQDNGTAPAQPAPDAEPEVEILEAREVNKRIVWTGIMNEMLIMQINSAGVAAFVRGRKANTKNMKPEERWDRDKVWCNETDGIMTMLWSDVNFKKFTKPKYESMLQHVTEKQTGLFAKNKHLWSQGQNEPAEAGTEGTKDETPLNDYQRALIECHETYEEALIIEEEKKAKTEADKEAGAKAGKELLDLCVKKHYGELSKEELEKKSRKGKGKAAAGTSRMGFSPGSATKPSSQRKRISVSEYCEQHESADEDAILDGTPPKGFTLEEDDDGTYLVKKMVLSFRETIAEETAEWTKIKRDKEKRMKEERDRELTIEEGKMALEKRKMALEEEREKQKEKRAKLELKKEKAMVKMMAALAKKFGAGDSSDDSDDNGVRILISISLALMLYLVYLSTFADTWGRSLIAARPAGRIPLSLLATRHALQEQHARSAILLDEARCVWIGGREDPQHSLAAYRCR